MSGDTEQRDERASELVDRITNWRKLRRRVGLSGSELQGLLYLGARHYVSCIDKGDLEKDCSESKIGKLRGARPVEVCYHLKMKPAMVTRIFAGLESKGYSFKLHSFNCERIVDNRVREIILSRNGSELYDKVVDGL
jgi:DNA-binding MarR family transcriptional regulator